jgi:hypothetical protein
MAMGTLFAVLALGLRRWVVGEQWGEGSQWINCICLMRPLGRALHRSCYLRYNYCSLLWQLRVGRGE